MESDSGMMLIIAFSHDNAGDDLDFVAILLSHYFVVFFSVAYFVFVFAWFN